MARVTTTGLVIGLIITLGADRAQAAEGMYLLDKLPVQKLVKSGLKIEPAQLSRLSKAVVQVSRGGTGSFVSPRGLVVTNHHVAYGCLARLGARKEHLGLLDRGYLASKPDQELHCPGYDLLVVERVSDVTDQVLSVVKPKMHWSKRFEAIRLKKEDLVEQCQADKRFICEAAALDGGNAYMLSVYRRIRDVRLVYAPPKSLGKFGGDVDNWMYPRHTADFAFLRAYVDGEGAGAPFAKSNIPLSTPVHLKVSPHGVKRGSLALVIGFPGHTSRHVTSHVVRFYNEQHLPSVQKLLEGLAAVLADRMKASPDAQRKYAGLEAGVQNGLKYYRMSQQGMERYKVLQRKLEQERSLAEQAAGDKKRLRSMRDLLDRMGRVYKKYRRHYLRHIALARLSSRAAPSVGMAYKLVKWGKEKEKENRMRKEQTFKDKNIYRILEASARLEQEIELQTERAILLYMLRQTEKLPLGQRPKCMTNLSRWARRATARSKRNGDFEKKFGFAPGPDPLKNAVDMLFAATQLVAHDSSTEEIGRAVHFRSELAKMTSKQIAKLDDPMLRFARDLEVELTALKEGPYKEVEQYLQTVLHPQWVKEVARPAYPDANFTVRLSLGSVQDYTASSTGKTHRYVTSLSGLIKKDKGAEPFLVPDTLKRAFASRMRSRFVDRAIKDIPINFTTTLDTTGGNSGSPTIDDKGRLTGLLFDGTPESILSDWQYLEKGQRSICMDIRIALFLAEMDGAKQLLAELGL